jgi:hypothetical protein
MIDETNPPLGRSSGSGEASFVAGETWGQFELIERVGRGSFGEVSPNWPLCARTQTSRGLCWPRGRNICWTVKTKKDKLRVMSATTVILKDDSLGLCVPSVGSVPIAVGTQVTFTTAQGVDAVLYFSPATAAILSPAPGASVAIAPGESVSYTVTAVGSAAYGVFSQPPQFEPPHVFDFGAPQTPPVLIIMPGMGGIGFSVASTPPSSRN